MAKVKPGTSKPKKINTPTPAPKEVAKRPAPAPGESTALTQPGALENLLFSNARAGMEQMTAAAFAVPRIGILQALSPWVAEGPNQKDDAEAGMIFENVGETLWDGDAGILFMPISFRLTHNCWWPRNSSKGKGFVKDFGPDPAILLKTQRSDRNENILPDGTEVVLTHEYLGYVIDEETFEASPFMLAMTKSQVKKAKRLNSLTQIIISDGSRTSVAPLYYGIYRLRTGPETNPKGQTYYNWNVERAFVAFESANVRLTPMPPVLENGLTIYQNAVAFSQQVASGKVKVAEPNESHIGGDAANSKDDAPM